MSQRNRYVHGESAPNLPRGQWIPFSCYFWRLRHKWKANDWGSRSAASSSSSFSYFLLLLHIQSRHMGQSKSEPLTIHSGKVNESKSSFRPAMMLHHLSLYPSALPPIPSRCTIHTAWSLCTADVVLHATCWLKETRWWSNLVQNWVEWAESLTRKHRRMILVKKFSTWPEIHIGLYIVVHCVNRAHISLHTRFCRPE